MNLETEMKTRFLALALVAALASTHAFAQEEEAHTDVEFGYDSAANPTELEIEVAEATATGVPLFEGDFVILDAAGDPGNYTAEDPGFENHPDEGLVLNLDDQIFMTLVSGSSDPALGGLGHLTFYNPVTGELESSAEQIAVIDNAGVTEDLVFSGSGIVSGDNRQFIGAAEIEPGETEPEVHRHVVFDLLNDDTAPVGAYGFVAQLNSNFAGTSDEFELTSDPFWVILNRGLTEEQFEGGAVQAFVTAAVPEPGSAALIAMSAVGLLARRRR